MTKESYFAHSNDIQTIAGMDALQQLAKVLSQLKITKALVIASTSAHSAGLVETACKVAGLQKEQVTILDGIPMGSSTQIVMEIAQAYRMGNHDGIIAIGGGSVIDTAKAVNLVVSQDEDPGVDVLRISTGLHSDPVERNFHKKPLVAIPTSLGPGSGGSQSASIHSARTGRRMLFSFPALAPDATIIDPQMFRSLTPTLTALGVVSTLSLAIEYITSLSPNRLCLNLATRAVSILFRTALQAILAPFDQELRLQLALASHMAGLASSQARGSVTLALSTSIGACCGIPYGNSAFILLPYTLEYNLHATAGVLANLYRDTASASSLEPPVPEIPDPAAADLLLEKVKTLILELRQATGNLIPLRFFDLQDGKGNRVMESQQFETIAMMASGDSSILFSKEELDLQDLIRIIEAAYWGYPLDRDVIRKGHQKQPFRESV